MSEQSLARNLAFLAIHALERTLLVANAFCNLVTIEVARAGLGRLRTRLAPPAPPDPVTDLREFYPAVAS